MASSATIRWRLAVHGKHATLLTRTDNQLVRVIPITAEGRMALPALCALIAMAPALRDHLAQLAGAAIAGDLDRTARAASDAAAILRLLGAEPVIPPATEKA